MKSNVPRRTQREQRGQDDAGVSSDAVSSSPRPADDRVLTPELIAAHTDAGYWGKACLHDAFERFSRERPEQLALVGKHLGEVERELTYAELQQEVDAAARSLRALGVGLGDVVAIQLPNWSEFLVLLLATASIGAVACPITHIYRHYEVRFILKRTKARVAFVPRDFRGFDYLQMMGELRADLPDLTEVVCVGQGAVGDVMTYESFVKRGAVAGLQRTEVDANAMVVLAFTSGTTGESKGVMHTHNSLLSVIAGVVKQLEIGAPVVSLVPSPVGHLTGVIWGCLMTITLGGTVVFQERWEASEALERIERYGVTTIAGATPFLRDLVYHPQLRAAAVKTLTTFICAGAPIPPQVVADAVARLGCMVSSAWGMSEYPIGTAVGRADDQEMAVLSDGRPCPGAEIRIVDETGRPTSVGEDGDLEIRGVGLFAGYYKRPDFNASSFTEDGFLKTGDRARYVNSDGFIRIAGRSKDIIIRGGENIPVVEIENLLLQHPAVRDVAIVAMPDERLGERACAFVVSNPSTPPLELGDLVAFLMTKQVAKQFLPERLEIIDELPRTLSGKVQKFKLRDHFTKTLPSEPGASAE